VAEAARVMGKSEGAVKVLQHAALVKLRRILVPEAGSRMISTDPADKRAEEALY
jgi:DNA-directed RNA polymerase specialized sigma24 family protein